MMPVRARDASGNKSRRPYTECRSASATNSRRSSPLPRQKSDGGPRQPQSARKTRSRCQGLPQGAMQSSPIPPEPAEQPTPSQILFHVYGQQCRLPSSISLQFKIAESGGGSDQISVTILAQARCSATPKGDLQPEFPRASPHVSRCPR